MAKRQRRRRQERRKDHARREGWKTRHSLITGAGLVAGAIGVGPAAAQAAYLYVGSTGDTGGANGNCLDSSNNDCTLRQALYASNANANFDYIYFESGLSGTITLGAYLPVNNPVGIYGPSFENPSQLTISGDHNSGIFDINVTTPGDFVGIASLRLTEGSQTLGGAVYNYDSELSIFNSVLTGNDAYAGGAVYEAGQYEGGYNTKIIYSTLSDNSAYLGGGMASKYSFGRIGGSTLSGNNAFAAGALYGGRDTDNGGGQIFDTTISGNTAAYTSGVITDYAFPFYNSILANEGGGDYPDFYSPAFVAYASLVKTPGLGTVYGLYNLTGVDPALGGLTENGGPTPTMRPGLNSPVIDGGYGRGGYDQRFEPRVIDVPGTPNRLAAEDPIYSAVDIGSVELSIAEATPPSSPQPPPASGVTGTKKKCKKKHKKKQRSAEAAKKKKCKKKKKKKRSAVAMARKASHRWDHAGENLGDGRFRSDWADGAWRTRR